MADVIKKIRTPNGDLPIDYNALANKPDLDKKLNTSGGTVTGDLTIEGDLRVQGDAVETHLENVKIPQNSLTLRDGATQSLLNNEYAGIVAEKYDGANDGMLVFDKGGTAYVGDKGDLQPLATRAASADMPNGEFTKWNSNKQRIEGSGVNATTITNIQTEIAGKTNSSQEYVNEDISHIKDVPTNSAKYVEINKIGGMSYKCNNLIPYPYHSGTTHTTNGITFTYNGGEAITASGTATNKAYYILAILTPQTFKAGTYYINLGTNSAVQALIEGYYGSSWFSTIKTGNGAFTIDWNGYTSVRVMLYIYTGTTVLNVTIRPMLNKGSTALPYEPYFSEIRNTIVTGVKAIGVNLWDEQWEVVNSKRVGSKNFIPVKPNTQYYFTVRPSNGVLFYDANYKYTGEQYNATFTTPASCYYIKFLLSDSYGTVYKNDVCLNEYDTAINGKYYPYTEATFGGNELSWLDGVGVNEDYYNYIDYDTGTYHRNVGAVDLGTLNWSVVNPNQYCASLTDKPITAFATNHLCGAYTTSAQGAYIRSQDGSISISLDMVWVYDTSYSDAATFKAAMNGVMLYYALETPEIENISFDIPADNFIPVESDGTITFENEYGYAAPSEVVFYEGTNEIIDAKTFVGDLVGTAARTVADKNGNDITKTYVTKKEAQLPTASATVKGGIKVGNGLSINSNDVLSLSENVITEEPMGYYKFQPSGSISDLQRTIYFPDVRCFVITTDGNKIYMNDFWSYQGRYRITSLDGKAYDLNYEDVDVTYFYFDDYDEAMSWSGTQQSDSSDSKIILTFIEKVLDPEVIGFTIGNTDITEAQLKEIKGLDKIKAKVEPFELKELLAVNFDGYSDMRGFVDQLSDGIRMPEFTTSTEENAQVYNCFTGSFGSLFATFNDPSGENTVYTSCLNQDTGELLPEFEVLFVKAFPDLSGYEEYFGDSVNGVFSPNPSMTIKTVGVGVTELKKDGILTSKITVRDDSTLNGKSLFSVESKNMNDNNATIFTISDLAPVYRYKFSVTDFDSYTATFNFDCYMIINGEKIQVKTFSNYMGTQNINGIEYIYDEIEAFRDDFNYIYTSNREAAKAWSGQVYYDTELRLIEETIIKEGEPSVIIGNTQFTESQLKNLISPPAIKDITYVGSGSEITFGSPNILPNGYITRIGGMGSEIPSGTEGCLTEVVIKEVPVELPIAGNISTIDKSMFMGGETVKISNNSLIMTDEYGLMSIVGGYIDFLINKTIEKDSVLSFVEDQAADIRYQVQKDYSLVLTINGQTKTFNKILYKTVKSNMGNEATIDFYKYSINVKAGDIISLRMQFNNVTDMASWCFSFTAITEEVGASYSLPIVPEAVLGVNDHYYNYIDLENNFVGILVGIKEFDGSEDEVYTLNQYYSGASINVELSNAQKFIGNGYTKSPDHSVEPPSGAYGYYYSNNKLTIFVGYLGGPVDYTEEQLLQTFRTKLAANPLKVIYLLPSDERRTIPLEGVEPIAVQLKKSNIIACNLPAVCTVKYQVKE